MVTPMPQIDMARPKSLGGLMSNNTAWDKGTSAAPPTPCRKRNKTIWSSDVASPQRAEATVKMKIETRNTLRRPSSPASQPVRGIVMAAATI